MTDRSPIEGHWANLTNWQCPFCSFDSLEKDVMSNHIAVTHPDLPDNLLAPKKAIATGKEPRKGPVSNDSTDSD